MSVSIDVQPDPPVAGAPLQITVCGPSGSIPSLIVTINHPSGATPQSVSPPPDASSCWTTTISIPSGTIDLTIDASTSTCGASTFYNL